MRLKFEQSEHEKSQCGTWHPQILADQLSLSQPEGKDYAHQITTGTPGFSDLPTALNFGTHRKALSVPLHNTSSLLKRYEKIQLIPSRDGSRDHK
jgi:hypothetical protein